jgi:glycosyltransferase involved in cell wall biosynthesis
MRFEDSSDLAGMIREQRQAVERMLLAFSAGSRTPSRRETELMLESTALRLTLLEEWLTEPKPPPRPRVARARYELVRLRMLARPRLGRLRHYPPKALEIPANYLAAAPPHPAPTISVVTPCLQHGRFIERTLQSVLVQNYPSLEYFVQDGGSTDGTIEILERYSGDLAGWASEDDGGQANAINRAFEKTSGEIMAWLNSDDLLLPGALPYVAGYFAAHPEVDVVYGNRILIDENDNQIGTWVLPAHDDFALTLADYIPQETLFWRRRIWEKAGGALDARFTYALDWDLLLRFRDADARMVHLPRFVGAFRIHDEQKTTAADLIGAREMAVLRERVHGRPVPVVEVSDRLRPYYRRHVAVHLKQRIVDRLPLARVVLRAPEVSRNVGDPERRVKSSGASRRQSD